MKNKTKTKRGRPFKSYSIKILPDGTKKKMSVFKYRKIVPVSKQVKEDCRLKYRSFAKSFERKLMDLYNKSQHKQQIFSKQGLKINVPIIIKAS